MSQQEKIIINYCYVIKQNDLYFDGHDKYRKSRTKAARYTRDEVSCVIKQLVDARIVRLNTIKSCRKLPLSVLFTEIKDEESELLTLAEQVVDSYFAFENEVNEERFSDKIIVLSNKIQNLKTTNTNKKGELRVKKRRK